MPLIDFILNLAGLLLWLNWRASKLDPLGKRTPATLTGTLRRVEPDKKSRQWYLPAILVALLVLRAVFYWQIGSAFNPPWTGKLDLGVIELSFRSDFFTRVLLFSFFSFTLTLAVFYLWLLLLSLLGGPEPFQTLVRTQLGPVDRWPRPAKWLLPLVAGALLWWLASWPLSWMDVGSASKAHFLPQFISPAQRIGSSLIIGANTYLAWRFLIAALLALHLLNSYIYFGKHPFWTYVNTTTQRLLEPLKNIPLRAGKVDFAPVLGIVLVFLLAETAQHLLVWLYRRLSS